MANLRFQSFKWRQKYQNLVEENKELDALNEDLREQNRRLSEINALNNKLLSLITHAYREPLGNIIWLNRLYQAGQISETEFRDFIRELQEIVQNTLNGLDNTLEWVKGQWNKNKMELQPIIPYELLEDIVADFKDQLENKQVDLTIKGAQEATLRAEPHLIRFVLKNLISNAIKFSYPEGVIEVEVEKKRGEGLEIHVTDSGIGMEEEILNLLFTSEQKVVPGTQGEKGIGVALIICEKFIGMHQGSIRADSTPKEGSVFTVGFPSVPPELS